jgi:hypothetical protein
MEKREIEQDKTICPRCLGGKQKNRKFCSKCKREMRRKPRRGRGGRGGDGNFDFNQDFGGLSSINWNLYDR